MANQNRNLYFQFLLFSLIIYLSSESELSQIKEKRDLQVIIPSTSTITSTITSTSTTSPGNSTNLTPIIKKSSSGSLSSGAIVGIVIPCIGALLAAGIVAALCRAVPTTPPMQHGLPMDLNYLDSSVEKFHSAPVEQIVVHQQPVVAQPVAVVQQPVVTQPVAIVQQPVAVVHEQVAMVQQPVTMVQQPVTTVQQVGPV